MAYRVKAYFNLRDVEELYVKLNYHSSSGKEIFKEKARKIAKFVDSHYEFRDEEALFKLFQQEMPEQLKRWKISRWEELVQFMD